MIPTRQEAEAARDIGIARAVDHADRETPNWSERAYRLIELECKACNFFGCQREFTGEALRALAEGNGLPPPPEARAWGAVVQRAARAGLIEKTGRYEPVNSSNRSVKPVWRVRVGAPDKVAT